MLRVKARTAYDARMTPADLARLRRVAQQAFARESDPWRQMGWSSRWQQELAFELALEIVPPGAGPDVALLDVGCGLGDLYGHLRAQGRRVRYVGIDVLPEVVERARARWPEARFEVGDVMELDPEAQGAEQPDYVLALGALSVALDDAAAPVALVRRCAALARRAAAVTFSTTGLRERATGPQGVVDAAYLDAASLYAAARHAATYVSIREEIPPGEAVLAMQHGAPATVTRLARRIALEHGAAAGHEAAGALLHEADAFEEADAELAQAAETAANVALRAQGALLRGDAPAAAAHAARALALGGRPEAHLAGGVAAALQGRLADAVALLRAGADAHPNDTELWTKLALILLDLARADEARAAAAHLEAGEPARAAYLGALADLAQNRHAAARAALERAVALRPDYVAARATLAFVCESLGDARDAVAHWRAVLAVRPSHPSAAAALKRLGATLH